MKIVLDCERMKYEHTGLFEYCHQLGHALKKAKGQKDQLSYYLNPGLQKHFDPSDCFIDQNGLQKFIFPRIQNIDLWHTTYQLSAYIPHRKKTKRVLTIHDLNFLHEGKADSKVKGYLHKLQKNIDLADHIVAISTFTKNDILSHLSIPDKPITVIYNGCAPLESSKESMPAYLPSKPFLFALGTVNPKKNFHVLVPLLVNNDLELIIAGKIEPAYKDKILAEAALHNVEARVKVTGPIHDHEKTWYYKNCKAFLFPSLAEGFGIPPIEAMRFGKPVFLSDKTSLPEIGGNLAYYFKSFDPSEMQQVFRNGMQDYQLKQPANEIIKHAEQFNWKNSAQAYIQVYRNTLNA
ncbi:glycosyltransferase family 4 protein [Pedobacter metabolipauper]|uniref:Glycosyltransferase involved in cell wall biosynthesis n=1 Tax=Pedobacter metabolipauper TaxID=425513 RepID=A0A4R6SVI1_9SPHI|nr:glycosyltransferase family 1 protein [Pedobacter metabolipauper]TDQ09359.1 glycosyltransferase involved in cell wall biosynthesis [Pedobacter metabolipauper]